MEKIGYAILIFIDACWLLAVVPGIVRGNTVRARHVGNNIMAGLRTMAGGEIQEYTKLVAGACEQAMDGAA